jgi:hypothetical protein
MVWGSTRLPSCCSISLRVPCKRVGGWLLPATLISTLSRDPLRAIEMDAPSAWEATATLLAEADDLA